MFPGRYGVRLLKEEEKPPGIDAIRGRPAARAARSALQEATKLAGDP
jgi:hypothetical protein